MEQTADRVVFIDGGRSVREQPVEAAAGSGVRQTWRVRSLDEPALLAALDADGYARGAPTPLGVEVQLDSEAAAAAIARTSLTWNYRRLPRGIRIGSACG